MAGISKRVAQINNMQTSFGETKLFSLYLIFKVTSSTKIINMENQYIACQKYLKNGKK